MPHSGRCFSGYRLEEPIHEGDLVSTWRATDLRRGRPRTVQIATDRTIAFRDAFERGAAAQRTLVHPNRVQVIDLAYLDDRPAVVTEFVAGPSLATWIRVRDRTVDKLVPVFEAVVRGVSAAHQIGVHHLSIDIRNVRMHSRRGAFVPKIDLSLGPVIAEAAAEGIGLSVGRLPAPPPLDHRADLFLLGTLLYEMVFRELPIGPGEILGGLPRISLPRHADLPHDVADVLAALLARRPTDRPRSASAVLEALSHEPATPQNTEQAKAPPGASQLPEPAQAALPPHPAPSHPAPPHPAPSHPPTPLAPHPALVAAVVALLLVAAAAGVRWWVG